VTEDGTLERHPAGKAAEAAAGIECPGQVPLPRSVKRKREPRPADRTTRSVRAVSGGSVESSRRRH